MDLRRILSIVLASPSDVQEEREEVDAVVKEINAMFTDMGFPIHLELRRWETDAYPGLHPEGPQGLIDQRLRIEDSDVLIAAFWNRFGTPVADSGSGTAHEIRRAISSFHSKGSPQVMLYFRTGPASPGTKIDATQLQRLQEFKESIIATEKPLVWHYEDVPQFKGLVRGHLLKFAGEAMRKYINPQLSPLTFAATSKTTIVRSEGLTELTSDIFLTCTYVSDSPADAYLLWFSIQVFLNTQVTSRLVGSGSASEVICSEVGRPGASTAVPGAVSGNSILFNYVSVQDIKPHESRTFRISSIRANATIPAPRGTNQPGQIIALVALSGAVADKPVQAIASVRTALQFEVRDAENSGLLPVAGFQAFQSIVLPLRKIAVLRFQELVAHAFKPRTATGMGLGVEQIGTESVYLGESAPFIHPMQGTIDGEPIMAGLANHGTRLQAVFNNIPNGVRLFVSVNDLPSTYGPRARLVEAASSLLPEAATTTDNLEIRELGFSNGSAGAVWEVKAAGAEAGRAVDVAVYTTYEGNPSKNHPAIGTGTVNGSFAPTPPLFTAAAGAVASATLPIPRFIDTSTAANIIGIQLHRSYLRFQRVTSQRGLDTGIVIKNISADPRPEAGPITIRFHGENAPADITTAALRAGQEYRTFASRLAPNFEGSAMAICNFYPAQGSAFIGELGAEALWTDCPADIIEPEQDRR